MCPFLVQGLRLLTFLFLNFYLLWSMSHPGVVTLITITVSVLLSLDNMRLSAVLGNDAVSVTEPVLDTVWPPCVMSVIPIMISCPPFTFSSRSIIVSSLPFPGPRSVALLPVTVMCSVRSALVDEPIVHIPLPPSSHLLEERIDNLSVIQTINFTFDHSRSFARIIMIFYSQCICYIS